MRMLYYAFVHPHISYGIEVYATTCRSYLNKLIILNNKIIRILLNKSIYTPVMLLYRSIQALYLTELHELHLLTVIHKCVYHKELMPAAYHTYFINKQTVHSYEVRRNNDLFVPRCKRKTGQKAFMFKGAVLWNSLPEDLKTCSSHALFKRKLKMHILARMLE